MGVGVGVGVGVAVAVAVGVGPVPNGVSFDQSGPAGLPPKFRNPLLGPPGAPELSPIESPLPLSREDSALLGWVLLQ